MPVLNLSILFGSEMKYQCILIVLAALFYGCGTSLSNISQLESIANVTKVNEDIEVTVGLQPTGEECRFNENLRKKDITILYLKVQNKSPESITIIPAQLQLRDETYHITFSPLTPKMAADSASLATWSHWLWGFIWLPHTESDNGKVSSSWLPAGLPIGAANFLWAITANKDFENDITKHAFLSGEIASGDTSKGMLFFQCSSKLKYQLHIPYTTSGGLKKEMSILF